MTARIHPSVLSADFVNMEAALGTIATADAVHVDVMDNHFVPNLTFGLQMVERIQAVSPVPLDVHLMIDDPDRWAPEYAATGAAGVTFHAEAAVDAVLLARELRSRGAKAGISLKPGTPIETIVDDLAEFDLVLVMTVEPGFGGQSFMQETMPKLEALAHVRERRGLSVDLQVDGGISADTIGIAAAAGADVFVAGSAVFGGDDPAARIARLREIADAARA
ncbi:ribulose-phosphate 3-epimerase [Labedella endophytica]|uniref:Ribulose-phosphate 3-epimerase n=1 Tax=Labedella endophytica TaxID=1523160 RepID=A0A3S1CRQ2_9MICO|nr:ribulose-phosphate 3-epimerase [Labedella endophytica]RUR00709.1 ribulose-phosphate 3-epimerase [Labedella endophytica]